MNTNKKKVPLNGHGALTEVQLGRNGSTDPRAGGGVGLIVCPGEEEDAG